MSGDVIGPPSSGSVIGRHIDMTLCQEKERERERELIIFVGENEQNRFDGR